MKLSYINFHLEKKNRKHQHRPQRVFPIIEYMNRHIEIELAMVFVNEIGHAIKKKKMPSKGKMGEF